MEPTNGGKPQAPSPGPSALDRRAFLRRASLIAMAAGGIAAAGREAVFGPLSAGQAAEAQRVSGPISGIADIDGGLIAVGGSEGAPQVLRQRRSGMWRITPAGGFVAGSTLLGVAGFADRAIAVGRVVDHTSGADLVHVTRPAVFVSHDGETWQTGFPGDDRLRGILTSVASTAKGLLAVGFAEDREGVEAEGPIAFTSSTGRDWIQIALDGLDRPWGATPTSLTAKGSTFLLGIHRAGDPALYEGGPQGWERLTPPAVQGDVAYIGAAAHPEGWLIAGTVEPFVTRYWIGGARGWREADWSAGTPWQATDLHRFGDRLFISGAGPDGHGIRKRYL